jgi:hypothetical protein
MLRESRKRIAVTEWECQSSMLGAAMLGQMYLAGEHGQLLATGTW